MRLIEKEIRKKALKLSHACQDGNLQSVFSCLDIVWVLYDRIMNWSPQIATDDERDIFVISKGQATLALYPVLIEKGLFDFDDVNKSIGDFDSRYCIQTDITKFKGGIENNAGSLGHGLPFAVGIAYANKIKGLDSKTYVLCGDGEFCEGTMWESCLFAASNRLKNLCVIVDDNDSVGAMVDMGSFEDKFRAFGFNVFTVNGHDSNDIEDNFRAFTRVENDKPTVIIAKTIRGYGSTTMMQNDIWFHKAPNEQELSSLIREVEDF